MNKDKPVKSEHLFLIFSQKWKLAEVQPKQQLFLFDSYVPPPLMDSTLDIELSNGVSGPYVVVSQYTSYIHEDDFIKIRVTIGIENEIDSKKISFWSMATDVVLESLKHFK